MHVILTPVVSASGLFFIYGNVQVYTIQYILSYYVFIAEQYPCVSTGRFNLLLYETGESSGNRYQQGTVNYSVPVSTVISKL